MRVKATRMDTKVAPRRERLQTVAIVVTVLGFSSMLFRLSEFRLLARGNDSQHTGLRTAHDATQLQQQRGLCHNERDVGLLDEIRASEHRFCARSDSNLTAPALDSSTEVTLYKVRGDLKATVFRNLELNMVGIKVYQPISDISQDGGDHDPRFVYADRIIRCRCRELAEHTHRKGTPKTWALWDSILTVLDTSADPKSTVCDPSQAALLVRPAHGEQLVEFSEPVILITRRDDHNPFFQVSSTLNAWIMAKALGWDLQRTKVVYFDAGYPSPVDTLRQKLLAPTHAIVTGNSLMGKHVQFNSHVMLAPEEGSGPMMQHLNDDEPCFDSHLFKDFRKVAMETMGVLDPVRSVLSSSPVVVTIITRRPYKGRNVQRVWVNEDEILEKMRADYRDLNVVFQSVDFVDLTMAKQMEVAVSSDVVIGMHGAGMVNVLWTKPETLVVEIFPKRRRRWGYRNLCQFVGCAWHEFRGGTDIGYFWTRANAKDKHIEYDEWVVFFDPLFRKRYGALKNGESGIRASSQANREDKH